MNFYQQQHAFYCGVDLHARTLYLCILSQQGDKVLHREVVAEPGAFLEAIAPYRAGLVVAKLGRAISWMLRRKEAFDPKRFSQS